MNVDCDSEMTRALVEREADTFCATVFTVNRRITTTEAHDLAAHIAAWTIRMLVAGGNLQAFKDRQALDVADGLRTARAEMEGR